MSVGGRTQRQFLEVLDREEAEARWRAVVGHAPLGTESIPLEAGLGRVLAEDVKATVDVPGFDRSNMDGFAIRAADSFGASEEEPVRLRLNEEVLATGILPAIEVASGTATTIATGGMLPRGADAVAPVEVTDPDPEDPAYVLVRAARTPGAAVSFAGTDMGRGETVLFAGTRLTSRETGVLAAIGCERIEVFRRPRVGILSTGDEIVPIDNEGSYLLKKIPVVEVEFASGTPQMASAVAEALKSYKIIMLRGHGSFAIGQTLEEAFQWTDALEEVCEIILHSKLLGEEMIEYRKKSDSYTDW